MQSGGTQGYDWTVSVVISHRAYGRAKKAISTSIRWFPRHYGNVEHVNIYLPPPPAPIVRFSGEHALQRQHHQWGSPPSPSVWSGLSFKRSNKIITRRSDGANVPSAGAG